MRSKITFRVTLVVALVLAVQQAADGVSVHYLFDEEALPAFSNWWGLLLLPAMTWIALGRVCAGYDGEAFVRDAIGALLFGGALAFVYEHGRLDIFEFLGEGLLLLTLAYPIYRAGCVVGFVFGAAYAFGPVVPVLAACALAPAAYLGHHGVRMLWSLHRAPRQEPPKAQGQQTQQNMQGALRSAK
ncbi:hypothetical protein [Massilia sp. AB1]|uniref:hypothetical protein n=1 Tax=Massilia sp. AB1 TaxID=2823371 RepID=UPI001B8459B3|nr:hypothetical protein [Massilia sp. AB1]MBQ5938545.1 hypothetical protein [Massilia sp. AB1]